MINKDIEKLMKIQGRINKNRFHLCVSTNLEDEYKWVLFLYMPDEKDYFSSYNKAILDSNKTTIDELEDYLKKYDGFNWR